MCAYLSDVY